MSEINYKQFQKCYKVTLTTVGPVFIGSGEIVTNKEYLSVGNPAQKVLFPDMGKFYEVLQDEDKEKFENYILKNEQGRGQRFQNITSGSRLSDFMKVIDITPKNHPEIFGPAINVVLQDAKKKVQTTEDTQFRGEAAPREQAQFNDIHRFIKDSFGNPYLPGSSLKGMFRTLFLENKVLASEFTNGEFTQFDEISGDRPNYRAKNRAKIEDRFIGVVKNEDPNRRDIFSKIIISDSEPISLEDMIIVQKTDRNQGSPATETLPKRNPENNGLPLFRECVRPGVSISFNVTIDTSGLSEDKTAELVNFIENLSGIKTEQIDPATNFVYRNRYNNYREKFGFQKDEGSFVYLGGGVGFRSKTVVNSKSVMARILSSQFNAINFQQEQENGKGIPLSLKVANIDGVLLEMGKCKVEIEPIYE